MKSTRDRWEDFVKIVWDPWIILLVVGTICLFIALGKQSSREVIAILTFIVSVASGILGGLLGKRWDDLVDEKVITARGKSATRDLKLLLRSVASLESRVRLYLARYVGAPQEESQTPEVVKVYLEEIIERCNIIEEQVINATENWVDVVPDLANVSTQIGVITDLKEKVRGLEGDLHSVSEEQAVTKDRSEEEVRALREEKRQIAKQLLEAKQQLRASARKSGLTFSESGSIVSPSGAYGLAFDPTSQAPDWTKDLLRISETPTNCFCQSKKYPLDSRKSTHLS